MAYPTRGGNSKIHLSIGIRLSSKYAGYMLFACKDGEERLVDMGSRVQTIATSSYLGELEPWYGHASERRLPWRHSPSSSH